MTTHALKISVLQLLWMYFFLSLPLCLFTMLITHVTYQNDLFNDGVIMRQNQLVLPTPVKTNAQE